jgi:hypothetical protein
MDPIKYIYIYTLSERYIISMTFIVVTKIKASMKPLRQKAILKLFIQRGSQRPI